MHTCVWLRNETSKHKQHYIPGVMQQQLQYRDHDIQTFWNHQPTLPEVK